MENECNDEKERKDEKNGERSWPAKETHFCWSIANRANAVAQTYSIRFVAKRFSLVRS